MVSIMEKLHQICRYVGYFFHRFCVSNKFQRKIIAMHSSVVINDQHAALAEMQWKLVAMVMTAPVTIETQVPGLIDVSAGGRSSEDSGPHHSIAPGQETVARRSYTAVPPLPVTV